MGAYRLLMARAGLRLKPGKDGRLHWMTHEDTQAKAKDRPPADGATTWRGLKITIENAKGSTRRGVDPDGHAWATRMTADYGYIRAADGADGDKLDCFLGPDVDSEKVFVVHVKDPASGQFDEDKAMLRYASAAKAKAAFLAHYDRPGFFGGMEEYTVEAFKREVLAGKGEAVPPTGVTKGLRFVASGAALLKASGNPNHQPAGAPGGKGGQFAPQGQASRLGRRPDRGIPSKGDAETARANADRNPRVEATQDVPLGDTTSMLEAARAIYDEWRRNAVQCPALNGEDVQFSASGWEHITKVRRNALEVRLRLRLLPLVREIIETARHLEALGQRDESGRPTGYATVCAWGKLAGSPKEVLVRVVMRSIQEGPRHFFSIQDVQVGAGVGGMKKGLGGPGISAASTSPCHAVRSIPQLEALVKSFPARSRFICRFNALRSCLHE